LFRLASLPPGVNPLQRLLVNTLRHLSHAIYLRRYRQLRPVSRAQLAAWEVPIAAARLSEDIADEEEGLLAIIKAGLLID
jgi:hypothetical protein